ncbi:hypothetical protein LAZ67_16002497 [Cordylochernes scorpioides]|uniref:Mos1 transposase HTH domain-containing protein n=1 Tax=Cordylochernes scorpioides TaxID=51811 RepID=A0ABY6LGS9_9ARAC|nr:hypothetical protein LAZ67_16002497 [Cordylochernes scorpioides]
MEAEYLALSQTTKEAVWIATTLKELKSKHIDVRYHHVRERIISGEIKIVYIPTKENLTDVFTKTLSKVAHKNACDFMNCSPVQRFIPRDTTVMRIAFRLEPTARARSLFSPLQLPTKDTSLVSLVLAEQPLVMELPLVSPASCKIRSVIRFLPAKNNSAKDIHTELCQVYGEGCMSSGMVRRWVREFKNDRTDVHDEPRAGRPSVSDETIAKVEAAMLEDRRVTVRKLCDLVPDVSKTTIDKILREHLGIQRSAQDGFRKF